jgi:cytochrome c1
MMRLGLAITVSVAIACGAACGGNNPELGLTPMPVFGGDPSRGATAIARFDCGSCHTVPGIAGAHGQVAAPLLWFSRRTFIAGVLPNTPDNLIRWIREPNVVEPKTAMPTLGLSDQEARDVAAYLYTLR